MASGELNPWVQCPLGNGGLSGGSGPEEGNLPDNPGLPGDGGPPNDPGGGGRGVHPPHNNPPDQGTMVAGPHVKILLPERFGGTLEAKAYLLKLEEWFSFYLNKMANDQRKIIVACKEKPSSGQCLSP